MEKRRIKKKNFKYLLSSFAAAGKEFETSAILHYYIGASILNVLVWFTCLLWLETLQKAEAFRNFCFENKIYFVIQEIF